jgi:hypothetical protein
MGDIIHQFTTSDKPRIFVRRIVDDTEEQRLTFRHKTDSWITTETGNSITLYGRGEDGGEIEVYIPISVEDLRDALNIQLGEEKR